MTTPTTRQVGTKDEEMPCGCIPYEHATFGPCQPADAGRQTASS